MGILKDDLPPADHHFTGQVAEGSIRLGILKVGGHGEIPTEFGAVAEGSIRLGILKVVLWDRLDAVFDVAEGSIRLGILKEA